METSAGAAIVKPKKSVRFDMFTSVREYTKGDEEREFEESIEREKFSNDVGGGASEPSYLSKNFSFDTQSNESYSFNHNPYSEESYYKDLKPVATNLISKEEVEYDAAASPAPKVESSTATVACTAKKQ